MRADKIKSFKAKALKIMSAGIIMIVLLLIFGIEHIKSRYDDYLKDYYNRGMANYLTSSYHSEMNYLYYSYNFYNRNYQNYYTS